MPEFSNEEFDSKLKSYFRSKSDLKDYIYLYSLDDYTENHWYILNGDLVITEGFGDHAYECSSLVLCSDEYSIYFVNDLGDKYYIVLRNANKQTTE